MPKRLRFRSSLLTRPLILCLCIMVFTAPLAAQELNYRLKWVFNTSVVGDLYAAQKGFFQKAGLTVNVKAGGPERDAIKELELGYAQFGVASADQVIRARAKGSPVVVLAQLFQINPLQWIYRPDTLTIDSLQDLKGKILGITFGGNDETIMRTLLAKAGLNEGDVRLYSVRYDFTPFYQRKVDLWPVYRNTQGILIGSELADAGEKAAFFVPGDYGVQFVANSVVTSEKMIAQQPDTVRLFIRTLLAAWTEALDPVNRDQALDVIQVKFKEASRGTIARQLTVTRGLIKPQTESVIGKIDVAAWQQTERIMLEQKQIKRPVQVTQYLKPQQ